MTDSRVEGWRALIRAKGGDRESVIAASGVTRDTLDGAFRRAGSSFSAECKAARAGASAPVAVSEPPAAWQSYRPRPGWEPPVSAGKGKAGAADSVVSIVLADLHCPYHHRSDLACAEGVIREVKPARVILDGDVMEMESLSRHPKSRPDEAKLAEEYYSANVLLDELQECAPAADWYYLEGNHENRAARFVCDSSKLERMFDVPASLYITPRNDYHREAVKPRGMHWIPLGMQPFTLGGVAYLHGVFESKQHAQANAESLAPRHGAPVTVSGHMHGWQAAESAAGFRAYACPWLGDERAPVIRAYVKGKPRPWSRGLLIIEESGELVTVTHVPIQNGRALYGSRVVAA